MGCEIQFDEKGPPKGSLDAADAGREDDDEEEAEEAEDDKLIGVDNGCGDGSGFCPVRDGSGCWSPGAAVVFGCA